MEMAPAHGAVSKIMRCKQSVNFRILLGSVGVKLPEEIISAFQRDPSNILVCGARELRLGLERSILSLDRSQRTETAGERIFAYRAGDPAKFPASARYLRALRKSRPEI